MVSSVALLVFFPAILSYKTTTVLVNKVKHFRFHKHKRVVQCHFVLKQYVTRAPNAFIYFKRL